MSVKRLVIAGLALGVLAAGVILAVRRPRNVVEPSSPAETPPPQAIVTKSGVEMVAIPAGWFGMGSDGGPADERPIHKVWVDAFLMDRCEVTQEQYAQVVVGNPSRFKDPRRPVEQIRWSDAILYCNARSLAEGLEPCYDEETEACNPQANGYRLPTEAEWEYACRAGTTGDSFVPGGERRLGEYSWYQANADKRTHPVAQKKPNPWGLRDMYGNVAEWCHDWYAATYYPRSLDSNPRGPETGKERVIRGGAWNSRADRCRSAQRASAAPGSFTDACFARPDIGFRCVRSLTGPGPQPDSKAQTSPPPDQWTLDPPLSVAAEIAEAEAGDDPGPRLYRHYCAVCHGVRGKGDGQYYSDSLEQRPADLTDPEVRGRLSADHLAQVICEGSAGAGKSALCPPWGRVFSADEIAALACYVRSLSAAVAATKESRTGTPVRRQRSDGQECASYNIPTGTPARRQRSDGHPCPSRTTDGQERPSYNIAGRGIDVDLVGDRPAVAPLTFQFPARGVLAVEQGPPALLFPGAGDLQG
jgi:formylglycine-generating enzyme required for sulfatase activity/mono/diheme cytochrome c family protein